MSQEEEPKLEAAHISDTPLSYFCLYNSSRFSASKDNPLLKINLQLREDLTSTFEKYVVLLSKCDRLQRMYTESAFETARAKENTAKQGQSLQNKLTLLEQMVKEKEEAAQKLAIGYEERLSKLRAELDAERLEKVALLEENRNLTVRLK